MKDPMENPLKGKKIGIWGFGKTGQSALSFLSLFSPSLTVLEDKELDPFQKQLLQGHGAQLVTPELTPQFIELNDIIIPSPGINLAPYKDFEEKFVAEVDLFGQWVKKPVIAITGSAGKTSTTTLITQILNLLGKKAVAAGNIGKPMLDVLAEQDQYDYIVLELSSFQLERAKKFAPTISTILNIFPNHLDRHADMQEYLEAKGKLLKYQTEEQYTFLPMHSMDTFWMLPGQQKVCWVGNSNYTNIIKELSDITCAENWNIILSILEHLGYEPEQVLAHKDVLTIPAHRVEFVTTKNDIEFYNDSKSTVPEATLHAVSRFPKKSIVLLLGGLSKGADRSLLIKQLPKNVTHIICFGKEAEELHGFCKKMKRESSAHLNLESALKAAIETAKPGDVVLLSPAGSSYDLYKNYEERGNHFKKLLV